jgi:hypothetical protein
MKKSSISRRKNGNSKRKRFRKNVLTKKQTQKGGGNHFLDIAATIVKHPDHFDESYFKSDVFEHDIKTIEKFSETELDNQSFPLEISRSDYGITPGVKDFFYDTNNYYFKRSPIDDIKRNIKSRLNTLKESLLRKQEVSKGTVPVIDKKEYDSLSPEKQSKYEKRIHTNGDTDYTLNK